MTRSRWDAGRCTLFTVRDEADQASVLVVEDMA